MNFIDKFLWNRASPVGHWLLDLLMQHPADWQCVRGYYLNNESLGIEIWIANKHYGIRVQCSNSEAIVPPWADRHLIWRHVKRLKLPTPDDFKMTRAEKYLERAAAKAAAGEPMQ